MINVDSIIRNCQREVGVLADGKAGGQTWLAIYKRLTGKEWIEPVENFPFAAVKLMIEEEGLDQPGKWPGGGSGITLGYGCDIGADPDSLSFWVGVLSDDAVGRLTAAKGIMGRSAAQIASRFADIKVTMAQALDVFMKKTLPVEIAKTKATYPGIEVFPPALLGAMTSIVYNRGTDLDRDESEGSRRLELRNIADIIAETAQLPEEARAAEIPGAMRKIAQQIQKMKRLWTGKGLNGLLTRRDNETLLVTSAIA